MATTSPDNIWTPDSGDDYALTVDLAATADTIQDALTDIRGDIAYRVGLNADRTALTGADLFEGLRFYATDTDLEWFYNGSLWRLTPGYIGKVTQTANQGFTATPTSLPGMSLSVTIAASSTLRITAVTHTTGTGVGDVAVTRIRNGGSTLFDFTDSANSSPTTAGTSKSHTVVYDWEASAGTYTINVAMAMSGGGSGTAFSTSTAPAYLSVERVFS